MNITFYYKIKVVENEIVSLLLLFYKHLSIEQFDGFVNFVSTLKNYKAIVPLRFRGISIVDFCF